MITDIEIGGVKRPFNMGLFAIATFQKVSGIAVHETGFTKEDMTLEVALKFIWCGLKDGARVKGEPFDLTVEGMADLIDADPNGMTVMAEALEYISHSISTPEAAEKK